MYKKYGKFELDYNIYWYPESKDIILNEVRYTRSCFAKHDEKMGNIYYKNCPASFDIETTSMYVDEEKAATMYVWMFSVNGKTIFGRTWNDFVKLIGEVEQYLTLTRRLIVYVHNLGFDFTFFCKHLKWHKSFATGEKKPIYAITEGGVEFRDSLILTGKKLSKSAEDLTKYKVRKQVGDLDYNLIRGSTTPLTPTELNYCLFDTLTLDAIIQEKIETEGNITKIPLTNTGYVRKHLREKCLGKGKYKTNANKRYSELMKALTLTPKEYDMLKRTFMGGFTHANSIYVDHTLSGELDSFDFTSSYPAVILSEMFPMSKGQILNNVSYPAFNKMLKNNLMVFDIFLYNLRPNEEHVVYENYLSESKCKLKNARINNGRVVSADECFTTITNIDYEIIKNFYTFDSIQVGTIISYDKGYLPKEIVEGVLDLYEKKTELKDVEGSEINYQLYKGMLNSVYGCIVTDIAKPVYEYTNVGWTLTEPDINTQVTRYNQSWKRFLYYPWGVFVTAYARRNLFMGIHEFGIDYIYSDTDSIKCFNAKEHLGFINYYNELITSKIHATLNHYGIDVSRAAPKNKKGVSKPLGVWDWETEKHHMTRFKTLGAKRYIYESEGKLHITIAGLGKDKGAEYMLTMGDPFDYFSDKMTVPAESTGKLCHTYLNKPTSGKFIDYLGNKCEFSELDSVHLESTPFSLKLSDDFRSFLKRIREANIYEQ